MEPVFLFNGLTGINNKLDPLRHRYNPDTGMGELEEAINCDIDESGMISRRPGQSQISSSAFSTVFCDKGDCFAVMERTSDSAIYQVGTDLSMNGVRSGLTKGERISFCQVGDKTYYSSLYQNGVINGGTSFPWPVNTHVGAETTREFSPAPLGKHIAYYKGRMWIADGTVVWISEPYAYGKFDKSRRFLQFGSDVRMIKPVSGGIWISDSTQIGFIFETEKIDDIRFEKMSSFPAHEWSENIELKDFSNINIPGLSAVWSSDEGLCIGSMSGQLTIYTESKLKYPTGGNGVTLVDGYNVINSVW